MKKTEFPARRRPISGYVPILRQGLRTFDAQFEPDEPDWDLIFQWGDFVVESGGDIGYACTCKMLGIDDGGATHFDADPKCPVAPHVEAYVKRNGSR